MPPLDDGPAPAFSVHGLPLTVFPTPRSARCPTRLGGLAVVGSSAHAGGVLRPPCFLLIVTLLLDQRIGEHCQSGQSSRRALVTHVPPVREQKMPSSVFSSAIGYDSTFAPANPHTYDLGPRSRLTRVRVHGPLAGGLKAPSCSSWTAWNGHLQRCATEVQHPSAAKREGRWDPHFSSLDSCRPFWVPFPTSKRHRLAPHVAGSLWRRTGLVRAPGGPFKSICKPLPTRESLVTACTPPRSIEWVSPELAPFESA